MVSYSDECSGKSIFAHLAKVGQANDSFILSDECVVPEQKHMN